MLKFGLEKEFFLTSNDVPVAIEAAWHLPIDDCGWLVEARSQPFSDPIDAVFSLKADICRIERRLENSLMPTKALNLKLVDSALMAVPDETRYRARQIYPLGTKQSSNFFGHKSHRNKQSESTAGLHVTVNWGLSIFCQDTKKNHEYNANFDWPSLFNHIEAAFAVEIKEAKRLPGFYELKNNGLVEYRSLPSTVNFDKLINVLLECRKLA